MDFTSGRKAPLIEQLWLTLRETSKAMDSMSLCVSCGQRPRRGRFLSCLHVVCSACVDEHTHSDGTRLCPRCTRTTKSRPGGSQLPRAPDGLVEYCGRSSDDDLGTSQLSDDTGSSGGGNTDQQSTVFCDECVADTAASHCCVDCGFSLCTYHSLDHAMKRGYAGHRVEAHASVATRSPAEKPEKKAEVATVCMVHPSRTVTSYCTTCELPLCDRCLSDGRHKQHDAVDAVEFVDECLESLVEMFGLPAKADSPALDPRTEREGTDQPSSQLYGEDGEMAPDKEDPATDYAASAELPLSPAANVFTGSLASALSMPTDQGACGNNESNHLTFSGAGSHVNSDASSVADERSTSPTSSRQEHDSLQDALESVVTQQEQLSSAVSDLFQEIRDTIARKEAALLARIDQVAWRALKPLEQQRDAVQQTSLAVERAIHILKFYTESGESRLPLLQILEWLQALDVDEGVVAIPDPCVVLNVKFDAEICRRNLLLPDSTEAIADNTAIHAKSTAAVRTIAPQHQRRDCTVWIGVAARTADGTLIACEDLASDDSWHFTFREESGNEYVWMLDTPSLSTANVTEYAAPAGVIISYSSTAWDIVEAGRQQVGINSGIKVHPKAPVPVQQVSHNSQPAVAIGSTASLPARSQAFSAATGMWDSGSSGITCKPCVGFRQDEDPSSSFDVVFHIPKDLFWTPLTLQVYLNGKPISDGTPTAVLNIALSIARAQFQ
ncbi:uncharacterized protein LOC135819742 [Sycon ciliatum]|uniref:uncharacterized protein LOC135819742 n=1 Tax=Sycon ciliatum TaxID=27933 RepID=UPI0031F6CFEF